MWTFTYWRHLYEKSNRVMFLRSTVTVSLYMSCVWIILKCINVHIYRSVQFYSSTSWYCLSSTAVFTPLLHRTTVLSLSESLSKQMEGLESDMAHTKRILDHRQMIRQRNWIHLLCLYRPVDFKRTLTAFIRQQAMLVWTWTDKTHCKLIGWLLLGNLLLCHSGKIILRELECLEKRYINLRNYYKGRC